VPILNQLLDAAPPLMEARYGEQTQLTRRWVHGELHDNLPGLSTHLLVAHYGPNVNDAVWWTDGKRLGARKQAGTITLVPAGQDGRWDVFGRIEVSQIYLPDARLQAAAEPLTNGRKVELLGRAAIADSAASRIMELLSGEDVASDASSRLFVEQAIDLLCIQLVRGHSSFGTLAAEAPRRGLAEWQVKKVAAYIREHLDEEVGLDDLAELVGLSRFHFGSAFRMATGRTPHDWLVGERIARARALLADPRMPVTEIALSVGYQTPSSFAAAFRKTVGTTPSDFRRRL
jgi:AraC family transcriptional regulator